MNRFPTPTSHGDWRLIGGQLVDMNKQPSIAPVTDAAIDEPNTQPAAEPKAEDAPVETPAATTDSTPAPKPHKFGRRSRNQR